MNTQTATRRPWDAASMSAPAALASFRRREQMTAFRPIVLKNSTSDWLGACSWVVDARVDEGLEASCGHNWRRGGNQLGQFPQILRRGGEEELVAGAGGTA